VRLFLACWGKLAQHEMLHGSRGRMPCAVTKSPSGSDGAQERSNFAGLLVRAGSVTLIGLQVFSSEQPMSHAKSSDADNLLTSAVDVATPRFQANREAMRALLASLSAEEDAIRQGETVAQEERRLISERTRAALAEAKRRGKVLGANGMNLAAKNRKAADEFAATLRAKLDAGLMQRPYSEIARHLNDAGVLTATGRKFYPQTVKNYLKRA
jgi:hypothetical protein